MQGGINIVATCFYFALIWVAVYYGSYILKVLEVDDRIRIACGAYSFFYNSTGGFPAFGMFSCFRYGGVNVVATLFYCFYVVCMWWNLFYLHVDRIFLCLLFLFGLILTLFNLKEFVGFFSGSLQFLL